MVYGFYLDIYLLHRQGVIGMGRILNDYDKLALSTLKLCLSPFGPEIAKAITYLEKIGDGAE